MPDTKQELSNCLLNCFSLQETKWHNKGKMHIDFKPGNLEFKSWVLLLTGYVAMYLAKWNSVFFFIKQGKYL